MTSRSLRSFHSFRLYCTSASVAQSSAVATRTFYPRVEFRTLPQRSHSHCINLTAHQLQSSIFNYTSGAIAIVFISSTAIASYLLHPSSPTAQHAADDPTLFFIDPITAMPGQVLPGRPGNLTSEQEAKLREFWRAVLQVFGVANTDEPLEPPPHTDSLAPPSSDLKQKTKRLGIFKRSKKDGGKDDDASSAVTSDSHSDMQIDASDDKYGQTKEFHQALASLKPSDLRTAFWSMVKHDHPDGLLLRFLRARKWDVEKALVMLVSTMHWRLQEMHVDDDVVRRGEAGSLEDSKKGEKEVKKDGEGFIEQLRMGKSYLHGTDKEGRPVCVVKARLHHAGEQSEASLERYTVAVIETARLLLVPPIDTAVSLATWMRIMKESGLTCY